MKGTQEIGRQSVPLKEPEIALSFLKEWRLNHFTKEDKQYAHK
jgi:hypothetical protein